MGTYRIEWPCCDSVTETEAWEPSECPFCELDALSKVAAQVVDEAWREGWAFAFAGGYLYRDDGELQDNREHPCIDFRRDSAALINSKIIERGRRRVAALQETNRDR